MLKNVFVFLALLVGTLHHPHDISSGAHLAVRRNKGKSHAIHHLQCQ